MVWLTSGPPPSHLRSSRSFDKNRRFGFCFVQFLEFFLCNFSKSQKQQKIGNWHCGILLIGQFQKMYKNATKCNKTQSKWCNNKHGASKIIDTFETHQGTQNRHHSRRLPSSSTTHHRWFWMPLTFPNITAPANCLLVSSCTSRFSSPSISGSLPSYRR
jgi:hypothetical protein